MRGREINCQMYSEILLISQFCLVLCLYVISWNCSLSQKPYWFSLCLLEKHQPPLLSFLTESTLGIFCE